MSLDNTKCILVTYWCVCVCLCACPSPHALAICPHYCTDPNVTLGNGRGCPLVMHYWADLQLVHRFCCCDNIARTQNVSECQYSL